MLRVLRLRGFVLIKLRMEVSNGMGWGGDFSGFISMIFMSELGRDEG